MIAPEAITAIRVSQQDETTDVNPQGAQGSHHCHDELCPIACRSDEAQPEQEQNIEHNQDYDLHHEK